MAFIAQRHGCAHRDGGTLLGTNGSVNIMTAPFELCVRAFDRVVEGSLHRTLHCRKLVTSVRRIVPTTSP